MESVSLTLCGEEASRFADVFVERTAESADRSLNKWGARSLHRYDGGGFTQFVYERGSAHQNDWVMLSVLAETVDAETCAVVVFVGGGGEGPFKLEDLNVTRLLRGRDAVGEAGRVATVLRDVERVAESLGLEVTTEWASEREPESPVERLANELFGG
jgi:hypothetical protein